MDLAVDFDFLTKRNIEQTQSNAYNMQLNHIFGTYSAPLSKRTSTTVLSDNVDGDVGQAPWLRAIPDNDPVRRSEIEDKIRRVINYCPRCGSHDGVGSIYTVVVYIYLICIIYIYYNIYKPNSPAPTKT